jgi:exodeoxyribonuclease VIII
MLTAVKTDSIFQMGLITMPEDEYHAHEAIGSTSLSYALKSAAHYKAYMSEQVTPSEAMLFGSQVHRAILEPERFDFTVACKPEGMSFVTKEGKAWREQNSNKEIMKYEDYRSAIAIANKVKNHEFLAPLFARGDSEQSAFWIDPNTQLECKARFDFITSDGIAIDFKTTSNGASAHDFASTASQRNYHIQAAHYIDGAISKGIKIERYLFVVIETTGSNELAVFELNKDSLIKGLKDRDTALEVIKNAKQTGVYKGYPTEPQLISLKQWKLNEGEYE